MTNVATVSDTSGVSLDGATDARFKNLAADEYRTDIQAVPWFWGYFRSWLY